jgi:pyrroloquinoline quinone biosynthesis protein B
MHVVLLGSAAGGGFPQWNCWCPCCSVARTDPTRARPRTQSSVAVSADSATWWLLNASPDVRDQLSRLPRDPHGADIVRHSPLDGVIFTDAELDHTLGLPQLREGGSHTVWCTSGVHEILERDSGILPLTRAFASVDVRTIAMGSATPLVDRLGRQSPLTVEPFKVVGDPPRFAEGDPAGHTVGLLVRDVRTDGVLAFVPSCGRCDDALITRLSRADLVLFDGTCWRDDDLTALGVGTISSTEMGHVPMNGEGGSLARLASLPSRWRVYTHINNTNPVLLEDSPERQAVLAAGWEVGADGMTFFL